MHSETHVEGKIGGDTDEDTIGSDTNFDFSFLSFSSLDIDTVIAEDKSAETGDIFTGTETGNSRDFFGHNSFAEDTTICHVGRISYGRRQRLKLQRK